jgi:outer membrane receptor protein involved in Fe transport
MSALQNYDVRLDYVPYDGGLISASWFEKSIENPIEYVQRLAAFNFTTPVNYPKGELGGYEVEVRQDLSHLWDALAGVSVGVNGTVIASKVTLSDAESAGFDLPNIQAPMKTRDMTNAPAHLYNFFVTYDVPDTGTRLALFYTVQGDTLVAGAAQALGTYVPNIYAKQFDTLNMSVSQDLGRYFKLQLQVANLTNPEIEEVYRSQYIGDDVTHTSYTKGIECSLSLSAKFSF